MSDRFDLFRSLVRDVAVKAKGKIETAGPVAKVKRVIEQVKPGKVRITEAELTTDLAHRLDASELSVACAHEAIHLDGVRQGEPLSMSIELGAFAFAPRGAKELTLHITRCESGSASDVVGALCCVLALRIWPFLAPREEHHPPMVERAGEGAFRVDLRSVSEVAALSATPQAMLIEALMLGSANVVSGAIELTLALPGMAPR